MHAPGSTAPALAADAQIAARAQATSPHAKAPRPTWSDNEIPR